MVAITAHNGRSFYSRWFCKPDVAPSTASPSLASSTSSTSWTGLPLEKVKAEQLYTNTELRECYKFSFISRGGILTASILMALGTALILGLAVALTRHAPASVSSYSTSPQPGFSQAGVAPSITVLPDANLPGIPTASASRPAQTGAPQSTLSGFCGPDNQTAGSKLPLRLAVLANFPDPAIYYHPALKMWYAFASSDTTGIIAPPLGQSPVVHPSSDPRNYTNIQIATSTDLKTWCLKGYESDPLPQLGDWVLQKSADASPGPAVWAPDTIQRPGDGNFILYYSARVNHTYSTRGDHCVGAAMATTAEGPYTAAPTPIVCHSELGGTIDPAAFIDDFDNTIYLAYKVDGNNYHGSGGACGNSNTNVPGHPQVPTPIMLQRMLMDGITPDPEFVAITIMDRVGTEPLVEAPSLVKAGDTYYLFFSSGCTRTPDYRVMYATAANLTGPYTRASAGPLLKTLDYGLFAPGSVSVRRAEATATSDDNGSASSVWQMALHGRVNLNGEGVRAMFTVGLSLRQGAEPGEGTVTLVDGTVTVSHV